MVEKIIYIFFERPNFFQKIVNFLGFRYGKIFFRKNVCPSAEVCFFTGLMQTINVYMRYLVSDLTASYDLSANFTIDLTNVRFLKVFVVQI